MVSGQKAVCEPAQAVLIQAQQNNREYAEQYSYTSGVSNPFAEHEDTDRDHNEKSASKNHGEYDTARQASRQGKSESSLASSTAYTQG